ncbi:DsbA family oxidoreductase [Nonomuraea wenchangensis]|uniref:DsbA family oxidoreductase n=1 Tax=Nonomuraea wenchangensis TaxID=568860 RepID=UPI0033E964CF
MWCETGDWPASDAVTSSRGRAGHQDRAEPMAERLFRAHFTDGPHIGDPATLARLAAEVGVTPGHVPSREVRARLDRVRRLGITGVPVFLIENLPPLTGSQTETALPAALRQAAGHEGRTPRPLTR